MALKAIPSFMRIYINLFNFEFVVSMRGKKYIFAIKFKLHVSMNLCELYTCIYKFVYAVVVFCRFFPCGRGWVADTSRKGEWRHGSYGQYQQSPQH